VDAVSIESQPALVTSLAALGDPDLVLDVRLIGVRPDSLDLVPEEIEREISARFFRVRVRDRSVPALPAGPLPPVDTIAGALVRSMESRITDADVGDRPDEALELREALRLARLMLDGREVAL
jgi:hypothetical protein